MCNHFSEDWTTGDQLCVSHVSIFKDLTLVEMKEVVRVSIQKKFNKRDLIFRAEEPSDHLYVIHKGRVKVYRLSSSGKEQIIRILEAGDFMGELDLFTQSETSCYAEALEETEVCIFHQKDIYKLMLRHPIIAIKILKELSTRLNETERIIEEVAGQDVEKRAASYLIHLVSEVRPSVSQPLKVILPFSKRDLASYIGTSSETLSRKLTIFQQRGWIKQSGQRTIFILNYRSLCMMAGKINPISIT